MKEIKDHYFFKAKKEGYPARSVYKLKEAQQKFSFLKKGHKVLDLGAAPGSWSKFASQVVGNNGLVVAIDIHRLKTSGNNIRFLKENIFNVDFEKLTMEYGKFNSVISDMAPKTTGRKDLDHYKSIELAETALMVAKRVLLPDGCFYCKVFDGEDFPELKKKMMQAFKKVKIFKPKSSRAESVEKFFFCMGLKS